MGKLLVGALVVLLGSVAGPLVPRAEASGIITHSWMALEAIPRVTDPDLRALLNRQRAQIEAGAHFPDSGYAPGLTYGEAAHWPRFHEEVARRIAGACDLDAPSPTCERSIAHLFGAVAHGLGDQVWDWLFEPNGPDRGESYVPPRLRNSFSNGGLEMQMDLVAIRDHDRRTSPAIPEWPVPARLRDSFTATGDDGGSLQALDQGHGLISIARVAERQLTDDYHDDIVRNMPWTSSHIVTAPGGIRFAADAIAAAWDNLWARMQGGTPTTSVSTTYPADGEEGVPATGWGRANFQPGSAPGRGGARNRITAVLDDSLPYAPLPGSDIDEVLPPGAMTLTDTTTEEPVPLRSGYPRQVPYGGESGEHVIDLQPDANLAPCRTYRVDVTESLVDQHEQPVAPYSWTFTTGGAACPGPAARPDAAAKRGATGAFVGDDVVNPDGQGQGRLLRRPSGSTATYYVRLRNAGSAPDRLRVTGQRSAAGHTVRYFEGSTDVTGRVVAGTYRTPPLAPGAARTLRVTVTVTRRAAVGAQLNRRVTVRSTSDTEQVDAVVVSIRRSATRARPEAAPVRLTDAELAAAIPYLQFCQLD